MFLFAALRCDAGSFRVAFCHIELCECLHALRDGRGRVRACLRTECGQDCSPEIHVGGGSSIKGLILYRLVVYRKGKPQAADLQNENPTFENNALQDTTGIRTLPKNLQASFNGLDFHKGFDLDHPKMLNFFQHLVVLFGAD